MQFQTGKNSCSAQEVVSRCAVRAAVPGGVLETALLGQILTPSGGRTALSRLLFEIRTVKQPVLDL